MAMTRTTTVLFQVSICRRLGGRREDGRRRCLCHVAGISMRFWRSGRRWGDALKDGDRAGMEIRGFAKVLKSLKTKVQCTQELHEAVQPISWRFSANFFVPLNDEGEGRPVADVVGRVFSYPCSGFRRSVQWGDIAEHSVSFCHQVMTCRQRRTWCSVDGPVLWCQLRCQPPAVTLEQTGVDLMSGEVLMQQLRITPDRTLTPPPPQGAVVGSAAASGADAHAAASWMTRLTNPLRLLSRS